MFEYRVRAGRAASEAGDHRRASEELRQALQLWRGPALVDVRKGTVLEIEAVSLEEAGSARWSGASSLTWPWGATPTCWAS